MIITELFNFIIPYKIWVLIRLPYQSINKYLLSKNTSLTNSANKSTEWTKQHWSTGAIICVKPASAISSTSLSKRSAVLEELWRSTRVSLPSERARPAWYFLLSESLEVSAVKVESATCCKFRTDHPLR